MPFHKKDEKKLRNQNLTVPNAMSLFRILVIPFFAVFFLQGNLTAAIVTLALSGLSDALDGWVARKTGTVSEFGARLDSAADLFFFGALLVRLLPAHWPVMPGMLRAAVAVVVLVRLAAYAAAALRYRRFVALHTRLNKLTGAAVFLLPYVLLVSTGIAYDWAVCALALAAALQEGTLNLRGGEAIHR